MTGLELLKAPGTTAEQITDIIAEHCPPVVPTECDRLSCRKCWLSWLTTGEPPKAKGPSDEQTAPPCGECPLQEKKREITQLGELLEEAKDYVSGDSPSRIFQSL